MKSAHLNMLSFCPLFRGISVGELEQLMGKLVYQTKAYQTGEVVAHANSEVAHLQIVLEGSVRGEMGDYSGKTIKIEDIAAPRPLAVAFVFGNACYYPVTIVANESCTLLVIPKDQVVRLMQLNALVLNRFMDNISSRAQFLSDKLRFLSFQTLKGKLAHYLLELCNGKSIEVQLPHTQEELAEMLGVTRPSLGRTIRELHGLGFIDARAKSVKIVRPDQLASLMKA